MNRNKELIRNMIKEDYKKGMTVLELALKYNLTPDTIRYHLDDELRREKKIRILERYKFDMDYRKKHILAVILSRLKKTIRKYEENLKIAPEQVENLFGIEDRWELRKQITILLKNGTLNNGGKTFVSADRVRAITRYVRLVKRYKTLSKQLEELRNESKSEENGRTNEQTV